MTHFLRRLTPLLALAAAGAIALSACSSDPDSPGGNSPTAGAPGSTGTDAITAVAEDSALHDALPESVRAAGVLNIATINSQPPWAIPASDPTKFTGASDDLSKVLASLLGVQLKRNAVPNLAAIIPGIAAKRFDFALGPVGDTAKGEKQVDMLDWVKEQVVFAVPKGNPKKLTGLDATCGLRIGVIAGGQADTILADQTVKCRAAGKPAVTIQDYQQQPEAILAVESGRSDAYFSSRALLTYYVQQPKNNLELASTDSDNGFSPNFYQGAVLPKGSDLHDVLLKAFQELKSNGAYDQVLKKWGLSYMSISTFGYNLVGSAK